MLSACLSLHATSGGFLNWPAIFFCPSTGNEDQHTSVIQSLIFSWQSAKFNSKDETETISKLSHC